MHHHHPTVSLELPTICSSNGIFSSSSLQNPNLSSTILFPHKNHSPFIFNCRRIEVSAPKHKSNSNSSSRLLSPRNSSCGGEGGERLPRKNSSSLKKDVDVATLGNLCVDIVLNVPELPPDSFHDRKAYMERLSQSPPHKKFWEAGGNCNVAIAAARLGLRCSTIGHVGAEIYGRFLLDVLRDEGIDMVEMSEDNDVRNYSVEYETLLCWVLVDSLQRHGFCSRADFSKDPAFCWVHKLSTGVKMAIKKSKILFCNGYGFDELAPGLIMSALDYAVEVGTSVFFDPGPKGRSLSKGTHEEQKAFDKLLRMSDVLLLTSEEAESLTGMDNPVLAGKELLRNGSRTKWVIIKMGAKGSILITKSSVSCAPAFKVDVMDTVGCGDSFVAAIAFGFIHNMPMVYALTMANAVGAATAMGAGAGRNVANLKQVVELMKAANLNEDDKALKELVDENVDSEEITLLSRTVNNGNHNKLIRVPLTKVVSEMLPRLESAQVTGVLQS